MGTYVYTISARTVPGVMIEGESVYTSNFAGKPYPRESENGWIDKKCAFADSIHKRNGTKPKLFTTTSFSKLKEYSEYSVYRVTNEDGITCYDDDNLGTYPECIGYLVKDGNILRFVKKETVPVKPLLGGFIGSAFSPDLNREVAEES